MNIKLIFTVLLVQSFALVVFGAVGIALNTENQDHPGKCWVNKYNQTVEVNGSWQPSDACVKYNCGSEFTLHIIGCGKVGLQEGQQLVQDLSKPHPKCCPKIAVI